MRRFDFDRYLKGMAIQDLDLRALKRFDMPTIYSIM